HPQRLKLWRLIGRSRCRRSKGETSRPSGLRNSKDSNSLILDWSLNLVINHRGSIVCEDLYASPIQIYLQLVEFSTADIGADLISEHKITALNLQHHTRLSVPR